MKKAKNMNDCLVIENYPIEGESIANVKTCVILPTLKLAFDIGKCPEQAVSQPFVFISHGHLDHIGGLSMYVASRNIQNLKPPTIIVPTVIKETVEKIFEAYMAIDHSELKYTLIGLDIGEEFYFGDHLKAKAFKTYHRIPSQGYVIYSVKGKLKPEYHGLSNDEINKLKFSGVEIEYEPASPEVAFTGDTTADFIVDKDNVDVLKAKILIMESTYIDNAKTVKDARERGHTHLSEIINYASRFENKAILLIHFSPRYKLDAIEEAISALPPPLAGRVFALKKGFNDSKEQKIKGGSKAGHETCVILPTLKLAFVIGKCPEQAVSQPFIFISHGHRDHIGELPMYVRSRSMNGKPPTIIVPTVIKEAVEKIFEANMAVDDSELKYTLIGLDIGEEFYFGDGLKAKAFKTYHGVPSQGYVIYSVKRKRKPEYQGLPNDEITKLKFSGVETEYEPPPEVAFTGDTTADFIVDKDNVDVLKAKILIMESTYIDNTKTVKDARDHGHTHLSEIINYASRFENKAILLIHFSSQYKLDAIEEAISALPPPLAGRVFALKKGFYDSKEQE